MKRFLGLLAALLLVLQPTLGFAGSVTTTGAGKAAGGGGGPTDKLWDSGFKSPTAVVLSVGDTVAKGNAANYGNVMGVDGISSGTHTVTFHIDAFTSGYSMWIGLANHSHSITDDGQAWAGGNESGTVNVMGLYCADGSMWAPGLTPAAANPDIACAANDDVKFTYNTGTGSVTVQVNSGTPVVYTSTNVPTGPLYPIVGFDHNATDAVRITSIS